jgi:NADH dehydrogenase
VIIGGGFGGLNAARALKDAPVRITLIDRRNYHLFQPLLYQVATASLSPADIATPIRTILRRQRNATVLMEEATAIDLTRQEVTLTEGRMSYDFLILAAGAETTYFGQDEWEEPAPGLKSVEDAIEIRRRVFAAFEAAERVDDEQQCRRLLTFLIVGGGPTGVELAGALGEIAHITLQQEFRRIDPGQTRIILAHSRPRILDTFPEKLSRAAERDLARLGVEIRTNTRVTDIAPGSARLGNEWIDASTIVWAAGVTSSPITRTLGVPLDRARRVPVEPDLTIPGFPNAFAIGDLAAVSDRRGDQLPGTAPVAIQQARAAAANLQRRMAHEPTTPFVYHDRGVMATVGRYRAIAVIRGLAFDGLLAWFLWALIHVYALIGFRNRAAVMLQWAWSYLSRQRSARLITGEQRSPVIDVLIHPASQEPAAKATGGRD